MLRAINHSIVNERFAGVVLVQMSVLNKTEREQGARPVLVLKAFSRSVCLIVPLTTSVKQNPYHVPVGIVEGRNAFAIISQLRLIDTKRLDPKIQTLDKNKYEVIRKAVKDML